MMQRIVCFFSFMLIVLIGMENAYAGESDFTSQHLTTYSITEQHHDDGEDDQMVSSHPDNPVSQKFFSIRISLSGFLYTESTTDVWQPPKTGLR